MYVIDSLCFANTYYLIHGFVEKTVKTDPEKKILNKIDFKKNEIDFLLENDFKL